MLNNEHVCHRQFSDSIPAISLATTNQDISGPGTVKRSGPPRGRMSKIISWGELDIESVGGITKGLFLEKFLHF